MANTGLYYPYINPPADEWTIRSVLYWDRIESIVPWGAELSDSTRALLDEGLLARVDWMEVANVGIGVADEFVNFIHTQHERRRVLDRWSNKFQFQLIHTMKMPHRIVEALRETELGFEKSHDWWAVRPDIASAYMSTLAWGLASRNPNGCDLLSDRGAAIDSFRIRASEPELRGRLTAGKGRKAIQMLLKDLFIVPKSLLSPRRVRLFKDEFGNELSAFRNHLNHQVLGVMSEFNEEDFADRLTALRNDLLTQSAALERRLAPSRLELVRKTVLPSVVGVGAYLLTQDFRVATALPVVLATSEAFVASVMQRPDRQEAISAHPMAYAALFNDRTSRTGSRMFLR
jgi:hypothetical protein